MNPRRLHLLLVALLALLAACGEPAGDAAPPATGSPLLQAMEDTEAIAVALAADRTDGVAEAATQAATALDAAAQTLQGALQHQAHQGAEAARAVAAAPDLASARTAFATLNEAMFALVAADPSLQAGWHPFSCPMAPGFQQWFQRDPTLQNPYFGSQMLTCGETSTWGEPPAAAAVDPDQVAFYTCPMHPTIKAGAMGQCPLCGMDLVPVTRAEAEQGVVRIDQARRQAFGVRTEEIGLSPLVRQVRATGRVVPDETRLFDVSLLVDGWIRDLRVDQAGQSVRKGQVLFTLYSPELHAAQAQLIEVGGRDPALAAALRDRLRLWGLTAAQVADIEAAGTPLEAVPILSPASGVVLEKMAVAGMRAMAGERLYRLASLDAVWVEAEIYEADLPWVKEGQAVQIRFTQVPGLVREGVISFLFPALDPITRTRRARVVLDNADGALLPDMVADLSVRAVEGEALQVPEDAVIYTGPRRLVFVVEGEDRLAPREVHLGRQGEGAFEVLHGLSPGDKVVSGGAFLVAAESRIRSSGAWSGHAH